MNSARRAAFGAVTLLAGLPALGTEPVVLTNQLGYDAAGPKRAVVQGHAGDEVRSCVVESLAGGAPVSAPPAYVGPVARWRDWVYWTVDFSSLREDGTFRITCATAAGQVRSFPFLVQDQVLERHTLSDVIYYFKGQRSSGPLDDADRALPLEEGDGAGETVDAHGGWYDATGDYGKHLSHLSFSTYFNPQQLPLTAWGILKAHELLQRRGAPAIRQYLRRMLDEGAWGADYLVRVKVPDGSFYRSVSAPGPGKRPEDRRIGRDAKTFGIKTTGTKDRLAQGEAVASRGGAAYQTSFRSGGGIAIAALARAAAMAAPGERRADYLPTAEAAWAFLAAHNAELTNDGRENIVDDTCALLAATELYAATRKPEYKAAADDRARRLMGRLSPAPKAYWRADAGDRPFFHAADAGLPVTSLLSYLEIAEGPRKAEVLRAVRASLEWELRVTADAANPFGYARQLVQTRSGARETRFFYPHDADTAPWWQGENARLSSLATAARLAIPCFADDPAFTARLRGYAQDQLNWILGENPFDASMLQGQGRNNPEYLYFGSPEYTPAPGGIVNGITSGFDDPQGIDFNLPHTVTGADNDWRWGEQWLPHATWYLLAVAAGSRAHTPARADGPAIIAYVFPQDRVIDPAGIAAEQLTHINYAFADIRDGQVVEGFKNDAENFRVLGSLRQRQPRLKVLVSVGGWTWSGCFSDASLTPESRRRFVESAIAFVGRHDLDGVDIDWEYPGLPGYGNIHRPEDKANFTTLMADLRAALDAEGASRGRRYLLTFAAGAGSDFLAHTEMDKVQASVDFVNLMTYDFREAESEPVAGHHANLYTNPLDPDQGSADRAVSDFLAAGVPPAKLVLGVPFYGRAWAGVEAKGDGLYQRGGPSKERIETRYGSLAAERVDRGGYRRIWDRQAQAPFLWNPEKRVFISYEDPESLAVKSSYILEHGLAGAMFWEYYSDPTGTLLGTLYRELGSPRSAP